MLAFELFISFNMFLSYCRLQNKFNMSKGFNVIKLKRLYLFIFKI